MPSSFGHRLGVPVNEAMAMEQDGFSQLMFRLFEKDAELYTNCGKQAQHLMSLHALGSSEQVIELLHALGMKRPVISVRPVLPTICSHSCRVAQVSLHALCGSAGQTSIS